MYGLESCAPSTYAARVVQPLAAPKHRLACSSSEDDTLCLVALLPRCVARAGQLLMRSSPISSLHLFYFYLLLLFSPFIRFQLFVSLFASQSPLYILTVCFLLPQLR